MASRTRRPGEGRPLRRLVPLLVVVGGGAAALAVASGLAVVSPVGSSSVGSSPVGVAPVVSPAGVSPGGLSPVVSPAGSSPVGSSPAGWRVGVPPVGSPAAEPPPGGARGQAGVRVDRVVVVGAAGLRWDDVGRAVTPNLARLVDGGSVGALSVRSAPPVTCPVEGWLTLGAGGYAAARDPARLDPTAGCAARPLPSVRPEAPGAARVPPRTLVNRRLRFGAEPGWLAAQLPCVGAVGPGGAVAAANGHGEVTAYTAGVGPDFDRFVTRCPATVVDAGAVADGPDRRASLGRLDRLLGQVREALPPRTVIIVLGVSETDPARARLHVAVASGPGFGPGWLRSPSTRRVPYLQLVDVAPTVVRVLGHPVPGAVAGRPLSGGHPGRPGGLEETRARLADTDRRAVEQRRLLAPFAAAVTGVASAVLGSLALLLWRQRRAGPGRRPWPAGSGPRTVAGLRVAAVGLSGVPAATFLANLLPWWRAPAPGLAVWAAVGAWASGILAVALLAGALSGPTRPRRPAPSPASHADRGPVRVRVQVATVAAVTLLVFGADAVTGGGLQIDSMLGYNPLVAGRFTGFGNLAFGVLGAAAVVLAALLADGRHRRPALVAVVLVAVPVVVVDGLPPLGADVGGVLTLVPAFVVLGLLVTGTPVTWVRLAAAGLAGAALAAVIAALDLLRPEANRSHFGRFAASVLDGTASDTIARKLAASRELLLMGAHTVAALALAVALAVAVFRPPAALRRAFDTHGTLRAMLYGLVTLAAVGQATNDSGVAIPVVIALVAAPATLALCASGQRDRGHADRGHAGGTEVV